LKNEKDEMKEYLRLGVAKWMVWIDMDLDENGWIKKIR